MVELGESLASDPFGGGITHCHMENVTRKQVCDFSGAPLLERDCHLPFRRTQARRLRSRGSSCVLSQEVAAVSQEESSFPPCDLM